MIVVEEVEGEAGVAVTAGAVASGVNPFAGESLDEAFRLAVSLGPIRASEAVSDAEVAAGVGKGVGAIGHAVVGKDGADFDAMEGVEADHLLESVNDAGDFSSACAHARPSREWSSMATCKASTPAPSFRSARLPVPRTPGRRKRPSFFASRWMSSPTLSRSERITGGGAGSSAFSRFKPWRLRILHTVALETGTSMTI